jgi:uncharacterized protein involved in outer membrane biogenesis
MRIKWIVLSLSAAILITAILLVILSNIDLNKHRLTIAEHVSEATGSRVSASENM